MTKYTPVSKDRQAIRASNPDQTLSDFQLEGPITALVELVFEAVDRVGDQAVSRSRGLRHAAAAKMYAPSEGGCVKDTTSRSRWRVRDGGVKSIRAEAARIKPCGETPVTGDYAKSTNYVNLDLVKRFTSKSSEARLDPVDGTGSNKKRPNHRQLYEARSRAKVCVKVS